MPLKAHVRKAKRKKTLWCDNQILDADENIICIAHLAEGRAFVCPYTYLSNRVRITPEFPCLDYEPIDPIRVEV